MSEVSKNGKADHPVVGASCEDNSQKAGEPGGNDEVTPANVAPLGATASIPADPTPIREAVGGRDGSSQDEKLAGFIWKVERGARCNFKGLGGILAEGDDLYRNGEDGHGLIRVSNGGKPLTITKGSELAPLIADRLRMIVKKEGKVVSELPKADQLNAMLRSETFLGCFCPLDEVVNTPYYRDDFTIAPPGYLDDGPGRRIVFTGSEPAVSDSQDMIRAFLDVMDFASDADRTNTVGAALTVLLRDLWPGGKPVVVITASKSHSGKGTVTEFIRGSVAKADILYENLDWPMQAQFQRQVKADPEAGLVVLDNVRLDSAGGRGRVIRSAFLEAFVTNREIVLASPGAGDPIRLSNRFVVVINTNDGSLSTDLLNRALSIHLSPKGSISERRSPIGNPKLEYLPRNRGRIEAELRGMIERWRATGSPLDESIGHSMSPWASTIGGILKVNGFADFLGNQAGRRVTDDPMRRAVGILGASRPGKALRPKEWARLAVEQGLERTLIPANERGTEKGRERAIGVVLRPLLGETFEAPTETKRYLLRLEGGVRRWVEGKNPHVRYLFEVLEEEVLDVEVGDPGGGGVAGTSDMDPRGVILDPPHGLGQGYLPQPDGPPMPSRSSQPEVRCRSEVLKEDQLPEYPEEAEGPLLVPANHGPEGPTAGGPSIEAGVGKPPTPKGDSRAALELKPLEPESVRSSKLHERFIVFRGDDRNPSYFLLANSELEANAFAHRDGDRTYYAMPCPRMPMGRPWYDARLEIIEPRK